MLVKKFYSVLLLTIVDNKKKIDYYVHSILNIQNI